MKNRVFEITIANNGYVEDFNQAMRYMLEALPECEIKEEKDDILIVETSSIRAADLLGWLYETDCLVITEIVEGA